MVLADVAQPVPERNPTWLDVPHEAGHRPPGSVNRRPDCAVSTVLPCNSEGLDYIGTQNPDTQYAIPHLYSYEYSILEYSYCIPLHGWWCFTPSVEQSCFRSSPEPQIGHADNPSNQVCAADDTERNAIASMMGSLRVDGMAPTMTFVGNSFAAGGRSTISNQLVKGYVQELVLLTPTQTQ